MRKVSLAILAALVLIALPAAAADIHIQSGIDVWWTPDDGSTRADFKDQPIPAGFFCADSAPFYGTIAFEGTPVATSPEGILAGADTVLYRLDDVILSEKGSAITRVQVAALSLRSVNPVVTRCGSFDVSATLAGEQPITEMEIVRESNEGGSFAAPLSLNVRLTFTSTDKRERASRQLVQSIELDAAPNSRWVSSLGNQTRAAAGYVTVDSDGDGQPETLLPGTSPSFFADAQTDDTRLQETQWICHYQSAGGHQHCYESCGTSELCP